MLIWVDSKELWNIYLLNGSHLCSLWVTCQRKDGFLYYFPSQLFKIAACNASGFSIG
jgi:hypothetical protein